MTASVPDSVTAGKLPPAFEQALRQFGLEPTPLCRLLLTLAACFAWEKRSNEGEVSCTGVLFTAVVLLTDYA